MQLVGVTSAILLACGATQAPVVSVDLLTFDGDKNTAFGWTALVDPVMGGESYANASVVQDVDCSYGILDGEVKIVPKLQAPGFITAYAEGRFPDASAAWDGELVLSVRSSTPDYNGFKVSFAAGAIFPMFSCAAGGSLPASRGCFKANFVVPEGDDFVDVRVPLNKFSDLWSSYTGEQEKTCAEDRSVCPTARLLKHIQRVEVWGEGCAGMVHLEVRSVRMETLRTLPLSMRAAAVVHQAAFSTDDFEEVLRPVPVPKNGEVLIRVEGASVNPIDWKQFHVSTAYSFPYIPGRDLAGTVVAIGPGPQLFNVGDKVWGMAPEGSFAEYVTTSINHISFAPATLSMVEAGVVPLAALTNLQAFRIAGAPLRRLDTVVVLGGSGGTGHMAIQMAKILGAKKIVTTCSAKNKDFCKAQGADIVVDYHSEDWRDVVAPGSVDFVYDTVASPGTGDLALDSLKDGCWFVTLLTSALASEAAIAKRPLVHQTFFFLNETSTVHLEALHALVDMGGLRPTVQETFELADVALAFNTSRAGHIVGKISVAPKQTLVSGHVPFGLLALVPLVFAAVFAFYCVVSALRRRGANKLAEKLAAEHSQDPLSMSLHTVA